MASMSAPSSLGKFYAKLHDGVPNTRNGGAIGDARHVKGGGYHISPNLLKANGQRNDYSLLAPLDNNGPGDLVSAQDWTFNSQTGPQGIQTLCRRMRLISANRDPRVVAVMREWFGTFDGRTVTGYSTYRDRVVTSSDKSHTYHIHLSLWRERVEDWSLLSAFADAILGVPSSYTPVPKPTSYTPDSKVIYLDRLTKGRMNSDSVFHVQAGLVKVLIKAGIKPAMPAVLTADYDAATITDAKAFQTLVKDDVVDGLLGPNDVAELLKRAGMTNTVEASSK